LKERIEKKEIKRNRMRGNYASEKQKKTWEENKKTLFIWIEQVLKIYRKYCDINLLYVFMDCIYERPL
jgi:hypothetical protein